MILNKPIYQGVIQFLKAKYCVKVNPKYITAIDSNKELQNTTILHPMIIMIHTARHNHL